MSLAPKELQIRSSLTNYNVIFSSASDLTGWHVKADLFLVDDFFRGRLLLRDEIP